MFKFCSAQALQSLDPSKLAITVLCRRTACSYWPPRGTKDGERGGGSERKRKEWGERGRKEGIESGKGGRGRRGRGAGRGGGWWGRKEGREERGGRERGREKNLKGREEGGGGGKEGEGEGSVKSRPGGAESRRASMSRRLRDHAAAPSPRCVDSSKAESRQSRDQPGVQSPGAAETRPLLRIQAAPSCAFARY